MAPEGQPEEDDALIGRSAVDWLFARPHGGKFLDGALIGIEEAFGPSAGVGASVPFGRNAGATDFYLGVQGRVEDDETWERFVMAHVVLADHAPPTKVKQKGRASRDPFQQFHLVLEPRPPGMVALEQAANAWLVAT